MRPIIKTSFLFLVLTLWSGSPAPAASGSTKLETGDAFTSLRLDAQPVFDGLASAGGRLFVSLTNGEVVCLGESGR